jgi:hypothetical protein
MIDDCAVLHLQTDVLTQFSMSLNLTSVENYLLLVGGMIYLGKIKT